MSWANATEFVGAKTAKVYTGLRDERSRSGNSSYVHLRSLPLTSVLQRLRPPPVYPLLVLPVAVIHPRAMVLLLVTHPPFPLHSPLAIRPLASRLFIAVVSSSQRTRRHPLRSRHPVRGPVVIPPNAQTGTVKKLSARHNAIAPAQERCYAASKRMAAMSIR